MAARINKVTFLRPLEAEEKAAPQMKAIIESVIKDHGVDTPVTVDQIVASMEGNVSTRQPLARIFGYYAPKLEEAGIVSIERSEASSDKPKTKKDDAAEDVSGELDDEDEDDLDEAEAGSAEAEEAVA